MSPSLRVALVVLVGISALAVPHASGLDAPAAVEIPQQTTAPTHFFGAGVAAVTFIPKSVPLAQLDIQQQCAPTAVTTVCAGVADAGVAFLYPSGGYGEHRPSWQIIVNGLDYSCNALFNSGAVRVAATGSAIATNVPCSGSYGPTQGVTGFRLDFVARMSGVTYAGVADLGMQAHIAFGQMPV